MATLKPIKYGRDSVDPCTKYLTNGPWIYMVPQFKPESVLMLGFAGGTTAGLIRKLYGWDIPITGVDLRECEPIYGVEFVQTDARDYIKTCKKYDVVIVDLQSSSINEDPNDFIHTEEFAKDLYKICNYLIIHFWPDRRMKEYRHRFKRYGRNKPNRQVGRIYYYGTQETDYNHLIIRGDSEI